MEAPIKFQERLARLFDNRLRIRWSYKSDEWHIEYKVGRGQLGKMYVSDYDDSAIRARDGYAKLMTIRPGDRMPCPKCGITLKVPKFEIAEVKCEYCEIRGTKTVIAASYFPLDGDALISHLCKFDPLRGYRDQLHKVADENNARLRREQEAKMANYVEAVGKDYFNRLVGIPQVGYTGKEFK